MYIFSLTQQALEMHKRKAVESSQTAADLKLHLDKYQAQLREAQVAVAEKTGAIEHEAYKYKRMQVWEWKNDWTHVFLAECKLRIGVKELAEF